jgi:hypothetical protein
MYSIHFVVSFKYGVHCLVVVSILFDNGTSTDCGYMFVVIGTVHDRTTANGGLKE